MEWVFGYGSLMWNPGFEHAGESTARLMGYHRVYQMMSTRNRGTPERPGLLLSLAPGGECIGKAFKIDSAHKEESLKYLDEREGVGRAHRRVIVPIFLEGDSAPALVHGWTYLPRHDYTNYIWGIGVERQAELVVQGEGQTGTAFEYLHLLIKALRSMRVAEPDLERLYLLTCEKNTSPVNSLQPADSLRLPLAGK